jgi:hypothetical protein
MSFKATNYHHEGSWKPLRPGKGRPGKRGFRAATGEDALKPAEGGIARGAKDGTGRPIPKLMPMPTLVHVDTPGGAL